MRALIIACLILTSCASWSTQEKVAGGFFLTAHALDLTVNQYTVASKNIEYLRGFQLEVGDKLRFGVSQEQGLIYFAGQETINLKLTGLLLIKNWDLDNFNFAIGAGYYFPKATETQAFREGMWLEVNHIYPEAIHSWSRPDVYRYDIHGNAGGFIRAGYLQEITKHLAIGFDAGYRFLKLRETLIRDHKTYDPGSWVEFNRCQNLSGGFIALRFQVKW